MDDIFFEHKAQAIQMDDNFFFERISPTIQTDTKSTRTAIHSKMANCKERYRMRDHVKGLTNIFATIINPYV